MSFSSQQNQKYYEETERYVREYKGKTKPHDKRKKEIHEKSIFDDNFYPLYSEVRKSKSTPTDYLYSEFPKHNNDIRRPDYNNLHTIKEERFIHERKIYRTEEIQPTIKSIKSIINEPIERVYYTIPTTQNNTDSNYAKLPKKKNFDQIEKRIPIKKIDSKIDSNSIKFCNTEHLNGLLSNKAPPMQHHYFGTSPPLYDNDNKSHYRPLKPTHNSLTPSLPTEKDDEKAFENINIDLMNQYKPKICSNRNCPNQISIEKVPPTVPLAQQQKRAGSPKTNVGDGDITNETKGFEIKLDVQHFEPNNIKISLKGDTLKVVGDCFEDDFDKDQKIKRTFTRTYAIPEDTQMDKIRAVLNQDGYLIIKGLRQNWKETEIFIQVEDDDESAPLPPPPFQQSPPLPPKFDKRRQSTTTVSSNTSSTYKSMSSSVEQNKSVSPDAII